MVDHTFYLKSGTKLKTVRDLANHFPEISIDDFEHHTKQGRNDFANWLGDVFGEHELAAQLNKCKTKAQFQTVIYNHLLQQGIMPKKAAQRDPQRDEISKNPAKFADYHTKEADKKDALADRFDAIHQHFQDSLHPETPKKIEKLIEDLEERYAELRRKISETRKQGKDTLLADLTLRPFPSKLRYATVSQEERDFKAAQDVLKDAQNELDDAIKFKEPDIRKEVELLAKGGV